MIAISHNLIRSVRRMSEDEKGGSLQELLSSSPSRDELYEKPPTLSTRRQHGDDNDDDPTGGAPQEWAAEEAAYAQVAPEPVETKTAAAVSRPAGAVPVPIVQPTDFGKVAVVQRKEPLSSSLARELSSTVLLRARAQDKVGGAGGPVLSLKVFIEPGKPPIKMKIQGSNTVEDVIELVVRQHDAEKRKPPLLGAECYDLRMLDDDDGTPDMDMNALERNRDIHAFNVKAVALVERDDPIRKAQAASMADTRKKRGISMEYNLNQANLKTGKFHLKVHMPNFVSHVIPVSAEKTLEDVLPLIAKKRSSSSDAFLPKDFKFCYMNETMALDMKMQLAMLNSDELMLLPRVSAEENLKTIPESEIVADPLANSAALATLNRETIGMYAEYVVIKTNQWGKRQQRIMGIDAERITNKNPHGTGDDVHRQFRLVREVLSVEVLAGNPKAFRIIYRDKNGSETRDYEAETKLDAQQIVAKINALKNMAS